MLSTLALREFDGPSVAAGVLFLDEGAQVLLVVPSWPFFNRHPVKWLPVGGSELNSQGIVVDGKVVG